METHLVMEGPTHLQIFVHNSDVFVMYIFGYFQTFIHTQTTIMFHKIFIAPNLLIYLKHHAKNSSVSYAVDLKCFFQQAENESVFCPVIRRFQKLEKQTTTIFLSVYCVFHMLIASQKFHLTSQVKHFLHNFTLKSHLHVT